MKMNFSSYPISQQHVLVYLDKPIQQIQQEMKLKTQ